MIGAMQEFNYQYGVDSYIRIGFDFTSNLVNSDGIMYDYRLELNQYVLPFCESNPDVEIKCYVNGLERPEGVPYYNKQPYLVFPQGTHNATIELRTNGPYLERIEIARTPMASPGVVKLWFRPSSGGWVSVSDPMDYVSYFEISDASGLTKLGRRALRRTRRIQKIVLPASLKYVVDEALNWMNPYVTIVCKAPVPPSTNGQSLFNTTLGYSKLPYDYGTLYVPKGCAQTYRQPTIQGIANDWSKFQNIVELDY